MNSVGVMLSSTAAIVALTNSAVAYAQTDDGAAATSSSGGLEEIIVTARKRGENLQDTPISITAFSADALERRGVDSTDGIAEFTPNLEFDVGSPTSSSSATASIFIRGIGQNDPQLAADPGVGLYVDGVYSSRTIGQMLELLDVERIEVLRGPQGTLFGRNTIGGAINILTAQPDGETSGTLQLKTGTDWDSTIRGAIDFPVSPDLAVGVAAMYKYREDWVKGIQPQNADLGGKESVSGRFVAKWTPSDTFTATLALDGTRARDSVAPYIALGISETSAFGAAHNFFFSGNPAVCGDASNAARLSDPRCYNAQWILGFGKSAGLYSIPKAHDDVFVSVLGRNFDNRSNLDLWGASLTLERELSSNVSLKSVTAYRQVNAQFSRDADHSPHLVVHTSDDWDTKQFTQELQLNFNTSDNKLKGVFGLYYFFEDGSNLSVVDTNLTTFLSGALIKTNSYAAFSQLTYDVTDRLSLTGGLRWTSEDKTFFARDFRILADFGLGLPAGTPLLPFGAREEQKYKAFTPMVSVMYRWTDDFSTYASISEGIKGGGFTQRVFPPLPQVPSFEPEKSRNYELGFKSEFADRAVRLNGSIFFNDYTDMQVTVIEGVAPTIRNAAQGELWGAELELSAKIGEHTRLDGGLGYLHTKYTEVSGPAAAAGLTVDKIFPNAPKWTLSLSLTHDVVLENDAVIRPFASWSYRAKVFNDAVNSPLISQPGYHLANAGITYIAPGGGWQLSAMVNNIFDRKYLATGYADPVGIGTTEGLFSRGREFSISTKLSF